MSDDPSPMEPDDDSSRYDPATDTYRVRHEWDGDESIVVTIVNTVSTVSGREPTAMEPLYEAIDPGAIDRLLRALEESDQPASSGVRFPYGGYVVTVRADGEIRVDREEVEDRSSG